MSKTMEKARKGSADAMQALYSKYVKTALCLARLLLQEENAANTAVCKSFRSLWDDLLEGKLTYEEDFYTALIWKLSVHCRAYMAKQDAKAVRIPANRQFAVIPDPSKLKSGGDGAELAINNLPVFQRFVYVLQGMFDYTNQQLAQLMHTNEATVQMALDVQELNYTRIFSAISVQTGSSLQMKEHEIYNQLLGNISLTEVPQMINVTAMMGIDSVCEPILQQKKAKQARVIQIAVIILICCTMVAGIALAAIYWPEGDTDDPLDTTGSTASTSASTAATESTAPTQAPLPDTNYTPDALYEDLVYYADIVVENYGTITVQLNQTAAPITAANFVKLAKEGFYDGLTFHRIVDGWLMQGGDPEGTGLGGAENTIVGEFADNGHENELSHTAGAISMARGEDYNSASSQFFIVQEDNTEWDGHYAVFGYVTEGMDIVNAICSGSYPTGDDDTVEAAYQPVISSITIREEAAATE